MTLGAFDVVVIIPTVRIDKWLGTAVHSILDQVGVNARVVVMHDGVDPDPTQDWMLDSRVTPLHSRHRIGLAAGLCMAIESTSEALIARLDADDIALPGRLAEQVEYLRSRPGTVLVGSQGYRIDESGRVKGRLDTVTGHDVRRALLNRNVVAHSSVVFRREAYVLAGGFDPALRLMEDYDLWMRMARVGPIGVLGSRLISYRVHSLQMTRGAKPYGLHIQRILGSQRGLARALGVNPLKGFVRSILWLGAQYLRFWRLRKSGYERE